MPDFADAETHPDVDDFTMTEAGVSVGRIGNPNGIGVLWPYPSRKVAVLTATEARSLAYHLLRTVDPNGEDRFLALTPSKLQHNRRRVEATRKRREKQRESLKIHGIA